MKQDECLDYSENLIKIKQLLTNIEQCVNSKQTLESLELATELKLSEDQKKRLKALFDGMSKD